VPNNLFKNPGSEKALKIPTKCYENKKMYSRRDR